MDTLEKIPWYRTRKFWGVVFVIFTLWSLFFLSLLYSSGESATALLRDLSIAFGAGFLGAFGRILGPAGGVAGVILHFILLGFLIYKTFERPRVQILYPTALSALFIIGGVAGMLLQAI